MKKVFRSRGIRIIKEKESNYEVKIYYEPNDICVDNKVISSLIGKKILSLFEYSEINGKIDTYNYHVDLMNDYSEVYQNLECDFQQELFKISLILDDTFKNYTVGYRVIDNNIVGASYYFYPTILKGNRYGIKGITDNIKINEEIQKIIKSIQMDNAFTKNEMLEFGNIMYKFKGVSVHVNILKKKIGYKIYGKISSKLLREFIYKYIRFDISELEQKYGESVLVAQRIENCQITGYNIYFLK